MKKVSVRFAQAHDFKEWFELWEGYNTFYKRSVPNEQTELTWKRFLDPIEPMWALVAVREGKIVGFTHYLFHRSTALKNYNCYLQDLFTLESLRGEGIGRALIEAVYHEAKEAGSTRVYWQTHETNEVAMKLYDQVAEYSGFIVYRKNL